MPPIERFKGWQIEVLEGWLEEAKRARARGAETMANTLESCAFEVAFKAVEFMWHSPGRSGRRLCDK